MKAFLLSTDILLSTGRNLLSKKLSALKFGTQAFFLCQGVLFLFGGLAVALFGRLPLQTVSVKTWLFALIYGLLLLLAQWFYTAALSDGNTALCSTVYSMGFIFPTLSGAILWKEEFSLLDLLGVLCAVSAIVFSKSAPQKHTSRASARYFPLLLVAMLSSGGLGILQKVQQKSDVASERTAFLVIAFGLAATVSVLASFVLPKHRKGLPQKRTVWMAAGIGSAFGSCNLLNTKLAGMLPSAVFFPTLNIGVILLTVLCGILFLKERPHKRVLLVLGLGGASILLLTLF